MRLAIVTPPQPSVRLTMLSPRVSAFSAWASPWIQQYPYNEAKWERVKPQLAAVRSADAAVSISSEALGLFIGWMAVSQKAALGTLMRAHAQGLQTDRLASSLERSLTATYNISRAIDSASWVQQSAAEAVSAGRRFIGLEGYSPRSGLGAVVVDDVILVGAGIVVLVLVGLLVHAAWSSGTDTLAETTALARQICETTSDGCTAEQVQSLIQTIASEGRLNSASDAENSLGGKVGTAVGSLVFWGGMGLLAYGVFSATSAWRSFRGRE